MLIVDRIGASVAVRLTSAEGLPPGPVTLAIDGRRWTAKAGQEGHAGWTGELALALARALVSGHSASVQLGTGPGPGPSLSGSAAALLWMDEQQRQLGTVAGIARPGRAPARPALDAPAVQPYRGARSAPTPPTLAAAVRRAKRIAAGDCVVGRRPSDEVVALDATHTLVLLECHSGAYNINVIPFLVTRGNPATARTVPGLPDTLTNAGWDAKAGTLDQFNKGRGVADCGIAERRVWTGTGFALILREEMPDCRGVSSQWWIRTWHATVRR